MIIELSKKDREIIRDAAKKQLDYAHTPKNKSRVEGWYKHNMLQGEKPLVYIEPETFIDELLPQMILSTGEFARQTEELIVRNYINQELFDDDFVTPDYLPLQYKSSFQLFGIEVKKVFASSHSGKKNVGHHFIPSLTDLKDDYHKLSKSVFNVDMDATKKQKLIIEDIIGDILPVSINMNCLYSVPTQDLVHIMSMENMMLNMLDYPDLFKELMSRIADDTLAYFDMLENSGYILPTVRHDSLGNGSLCYTSELPGEEEAANRRLTTSDVWGFMDSQETIGISPQMFEEFVFPCYEKIASRFGMLSYGCCEPVDKIWENCLSRLPNLRKLSISPWANEELMGEWLAGQNIIYFRKPSPNFLGVSKSLDEDAVRAHISKSLTAAKGCKIEIAQRDVYTIHHNTTKVRRYIEIIREEIDSVMAQS